MLRTPYCSMAVAYRRANVNRSERLEFSAPWTYSGFQAS